MDDEIKWLSLKQVCELTSLSRTAINNWRESGKFPAPIELGERRLAFRRSEVLQWMADQVARRRPVDRLGGARAAA